MKRSSQGGGSPTQKFQYFCDNDSDDDDEMTNKLQMISQSSSSVKLDFGETLACSQGGSDITLSQHHSNSFRDLLLPSSGSCVSENQPDLLVTETEDKFDNYDEEFNNSSSDDSLSSKEVPTFDFPIDDFVNSVGVTNAAAYILANAELKQELSHQIFQASHKSLKTSLKN